VVTIDMADVFLNLLWRASALLAVLSLTVVTLLALHRYGRNRHELRHARRRRELRRLALQLLEQPELIIEARKHFRAGDRRLLLGLFEELRKQLKGEYAERLNSLMRILGLMAECVELLKHPIWYRRAQAAELLGHFNDPNVVLALYRTLEDRRHEVRVAAARALARLHAVQSVREIAAALVGRRTDPSLAVTEVFRSLDRKHVPELRELVRDRAVPLTTRVLAIDALGRLGDLSAVEELLETYDHPHLPMRIATIQALSRLGDPRSVTVILLAMTDEAWEVRAQAALCAGRLGSQEALPLLQHLLTDSQWWVRYHAAQSLALLGGPGVLCLQATAEEGQPEAANIAWGVLREKGLAVV
jgi:HEAT repeat protein